MMAAPDHVSALDQLQQLVDGYGFRYVLIKGGAKRPNNKAWQQGATRDQAEKWLGQGNNIGLAIPDGVVVLDIDPRNGGLDSWKQLRVDLELAQANTLVAKTGGGGLHIFLAVPAGFKAYGQVPGYPGIDIKQQGGYVVAPPSVHETGNPYEWHRWTPVLEEAETKIEHLIERQTTSSSHDYEPIEDMDLFQEILLALVPEQFSDYDAWIEISMALHALVDGNEDAGDLWVEWCRLDPEYADREDQFGHWTSFTSGGVTAATVLKFLNKADPELADRVSREINFAGVRAASEFEPVTQEMLDALPEAPLPQPVSDTERSQRPYWRRVDLQSDALPTYRWLFKNLFPRHTYAVLTGPSGVGKSQAALDLALHLVGGHDWQGHRCKAPARVGYIDIEQGEEGHKLRRFAWDKLKGLPYDKSNLYISGITPRLVKGQDSAAFEAMLQGIKDAAMDLVIFDTLSATMGGNVSDGNDVMALLQSKQRILDETDAAVLFVAHMGKDMSRGNKGFTEITDQADLVFEIHQQDRASIPWLVPVKNRWSKAGGADGWKMHSEEVVIGQDEDGDDVVSVAVRFGDFERVDLEALPDATAEQRGADILATVEDNPGVTKNALAKLIGGRKAAVMAIVDHLIDEGQITVKEGSNRSLQLHRTNEVEDLL